MKIIATYLPQFHRIPENDEWWGEGFTEWTNVKKSTPLFDGHYQPRIPLENNYYDLSDGVEILNQMEMASEYMVDCFAIYHYWFCGKQLLEKPINFLLNHTKIPIEFCFCWANGAWTRTWDGDDSANEVLIAQQYGDIHDWKNHYLYLRQFFMHPRYLKEGKRPVLIIYDAGILENQESMFKYWNCLSIEDGFDGIKIVTTRRINNLKYFPVYGDEVFDFEPFATLNSICDNEKNAMSKLYETNENQYRVIDYKLFCERMVARRYLFNKSNYGLFVGWDNSPRRRKKTKLIFENNAPDVFEWVFAKQYKKTLMMGNMYLYINAWNEWGEGTYLEPDSKYKFGYLEAIRSIIKNEN